ncbi:NucA/NucB deoxyribonuclease domain-containing protein [Streptomyces glaucescens]|uniref:NucA/NucB deoxyribonuclease domain-containing protein n=1 Tax=Streptomyces glaucescens TaxID=1907 RepID=UPI00344F4BB3
MQRPPGKSCDEHAFASTWQGAKYGSGKFSRRMIDAGQNTNAGKALKGFYAYTRVLEGDRCLVWIRSTHPDEIRRGHRESASPYRRSTGAR